MHSIYNWCMLCKVRYQGTNIDSYVYFKCLVGVGRELVLQDLATLKSDNISHRSEELSHNISTLQMQRSSQHDRD